MRQRFRLVFGRCSVRVSAGASFVLIEDFRGSPQCLQENSGIVSRLGCALFQDLFNSSSTYHPNIRHYTTKLLTTSSNPPPPAHTHTHTHTHTHIYARAQTILHVLQILFVALRAIPVAEIRVRGGQTYFQLPRSLSTCSNTDMQKAETWVFGKRNGLS
jgi:hypothetical protein